MCKLTNEEVLEIYYSSELQKDLADKYGVTFQMISRIKRHKAWTHITGGKPNGTRAGSIHEEPHIVDEP